MSGLIRSAAIILLLAAIVGIAMAGDDGGGHSGGSQAEGAGSSGGSHDSGSSGSHDTGGSAASSSGSHDGGGSGSAAASGSSGSGNSDGGSHDHGSSQASGNDPGSSPGTSRGEGNSYSSGPGSRSGHESNNGGSDSARGGNDQPVKESPSGNRDAQKAVSPSSSLRGSKGEPVKEGGEQGTPEKTPGKSPGIEMNRAGSRDPSPFTPGKEKETSGKTSEQNIPEDHGNKESESRNTRDSHSDGIKATGESDREGAVNIPETERVPGVTFDGSVGEVSGGGDDSVPGSTVNAEIPEPPEDEGRASDNGANVPVEPPQNHVPYGEVPFATVPSLPGTALPLTVPSPSASAQGIAPKGRLKGEHEPFWKNSDSSFVMGPLALLKIWFFLGFRRVERKNVLEHDERKTLYQKIVTYPGVDLSRLVEMAGLNKETARYHIKMLTMNGKISGLIKQGIARYFPSRETISEYEKTVIHYLWISTTKRILLLLLETPGLTRQAISDELGIAGPSVTWQMQRLAEDGLIEIQNEGRFVRYFLTKNSIETLNSVNKTGAGIGAFS